MSGDVSVQPSGSNTIASVVIPLDTKCLVSFHRSSEPQASQYSGSSRTAQVPMVYVVGLQGL